MHHRDWLVKDLDKIVCLLCKLFKKKLQPCNLAHERIHNWGHLVHNLKMHESSV